MKKILIVLLALVVGLGAIIFLSNLDTGETAEEKVIVELGKTNILAEKAKALSEKIQGLSGREFLEKDHGMLFVYDSPGIHSIWMKNMHFPIDIIWIGEDLRIVEIKKNARPESFPESFTPEKKTKYILEVNAGVAEESGIKKGDRVNFK